MEIAEAPFNALRVGSETFLLRGFRSALLRSTHIGPLRGQQGIKLCVQQKTCGTRLAWEGTTGGVNCFR